MASVCSIAAQLEERKGGGVLGTAAAVLDARQYKVEIETGFLEIRSNLKLYG